MKNKGIIATIELIIVIVVLIVAFSIFLPTFTFKSRWSDALILLKSRDTILTLDRIGKLYDYSFDSQSLNNFLNDILPLNIIPWSEVDGTIKSKVFIACNCTNEQIAKLTNWISYLKFNNRDVDFLICYTNLEAINPCLRGSDVLLIWGYKDLSDPVFKNTLKEFLKKESGIVEIVDFPSGLRDLDVVQKEIFGITKHPSETWDNVDYDAIIKPLNSSNTTYQSYKIFYHIPIFVDAPDTDTTIPVEGGLTSPSCTNINKGNFIFRDNSNTFWICDGNSVYFDTNGNNIADVKSSVREEFSIQGYKFFLNYVDDNFRIGVSFKPVYKFVDFCRTPSFKKVGPIDEDSGRALVVGVKELGTRENIRNYCTILNETSYARTVWITDFSRDGLDNVGHDQKNLLLSLLLWASNKKSSELILGNIKIGFGSSYINVASEDMFEVYKFSLGLGSPY